MARIPVLLAAADVEDEIREILLPAPGVDHFGMKLDSVELAVGRGDGGDRAGVGAAEHGEALGDAADHVAMAHPDLLRAGEPGEQRIGAVVEFEGGEAVLALVALADLAAQQVRHELLAVADAEHRLAAVENRRIDGGAAGS